MSAEQAAREEERRARLGENADLMRQIMPYGARMALYSGHSHFVMGEQLAIPENLEPLEYVARLSPHGQVFVGVPSGPINVVGNFGSALSSLLARTWDRHDNAKTLKRVGKPMIGSFVNEFDTMRQVLVYINGVEVREPARIIVEECGRQQRKIFEPTLDEHGVPQQDAFVLKVVRSRGNVPDLFTFEGMGPAGTWHGFRMCHEDCCSILSNIAKNIAKSELENFEVVVVIEGVNAEMVDGQMTMMATGPLHIEAVKPIQISPEEEVEILAAFKNLPGEPVPLTADEIYARSLVYRGFCLP